MSVQRNTQNAKTKEFVKNELKGWQRGIMTIVCPLYLQFAHVELYEQLHYNAQRVSTLCCKISHYMTSMTGAKYDREIKNWNADQYLKCDIITFIKHFINPPLFHANTALCQFNFNVKSFLVDKFHQFVYHRINKITKSFGFGEFGALFKYNVTSILKFIIRVIKIMKQEYPDRSSRKSKWTIYDFIGIDIISLIDDAFKSSLDPVYRAELEYQYELLNKAFESDEFVVDHYESLDPVYRAELDYQYDLLNGHSHF